MENSRVVTISNSINSNEYQRILSILNHYLITPTDIERIRSVYKISSSDKNYCLKRINHGNTKPLKGMTLVNYLKARGFDNVAEYIKTKDGKECVRYKKNLYYLTEWIDGRECNVDNFDELKKAAQLLAQFHIKSKGFYSREVKIESNHKNWPNKLNAIKKDLFIYKGLIEHKKIKSTFDLEYYEHIDSFQELMDISINLLNNSNYMEASRAAKRMHCICHDSFYYQNILINNDDKMYLIDLDSTIYDINVYDLGKFIRRILYKKKYSWNFEIARELIESYSIINKLSIEEYEILLAFIIFPHKFWKIGKKRYYKSKKWNEDKYMKRLKKVLSFTEKQRDFTNKFVEYYKLVI